MKRKYAVVTLALFIVAFIVTFPMIGCKGATVTPAAKAETAAPETTAPETTAPEATASSETTETVQPTVAAEKITKIGAEMTGAIPSFMCINKKNMVTVEVKNTSDFT